MNQTEARDFVKQLAARQTAFSSYKQRTKELINDPDDINQTVFGICGLAVMVRSLLQYDLQKFTELLSAIFEDAPFNGIQVAQGKLLAGRVKQWKRKEAHNAGTDDEVEPDNELDFILCRSLGKLLKQQAPEHYRSLLEIGVEISPTFKVDPDSPYVRLFELDQKYAASLDIGVLTDDIAKRLRWNTATAKMLCGFGLDPTGATVSVNDPGKEWTITLQEKQRELTVRAENGVLVVSFYAYYPYSDTDIWQKDGDLALGTTGVSRLMRNVVKAASYTFTNATSDPLAAITTINREFDQPKPYVYAFVNGAQAWIEASDGMTGQFDNPAPPPTRFFGNIAPFGAHIVAITGKITHVGGRVQVPTWSWTDSFTADIPVQHLAGYLSGYCHGQM
jgi:hypothetical protein